MKSFKLCLLLTGILVVNLYSQHDPKQTGLDAITEQAVMGQLEFLASDWTEGRQVGSKGAYMAADYIASIFKVYGLQPGGDEEWIRPSRQDRMRGVEDKKIRSFYQSFNLIEFSAGENQELSLTTKKNTGITTYHFENRTDFNVFPAEVAIEIEAPVVFVGYGYVNEKYGYNDYKGMDVNGKIILRLSGYPGHSDTTSKAYQTFNQDGKLSSREVRRGKNTVAKEKGAVAILEADPETDPSANWIDNLPFRYNTRMYEGDKRQESYYDFRMTLPGDSLDDDLTTFYINDRVMNEITEGSGIRVDQYMEQAAKNLRSSSREIAGKSVKLKTSVNSRLVKVRNVIGIIPGKDTSDYIVIGAHYDHLGKHDGYIWNGADDNASGTVGVMTIAKAFMASGTKPEKTIVFAAWTGEEKGLLGSQYFVDHPVIPDGKNLLNLNYDMISRDNYDDTLGVQCRLVYTEDYPVLEETTKKHNEDYELGLDITYRPSKEPRGGSDHAPFARKKIPVMYFMAGFPIEYHQPDDHISKVNLDKMTRIIKLGFLNIWELANNSWQKEE